MDERYQQALDGTLKSPGGDKMGEIHLKNDLVNALTVFWADHQGRQRPLKVTKIPAEEESSWLLPGGTYMIKDVKENSHLVFRLAASGGFVCVLTMTKTQRSYTIGSSVLTRPNDIGTYPRPTKTTVIPVNSPRVVVGNGMKKFTKEGRLFERPLTREQFWRRGNDSYMLAPREKRSIHYTTKNGLEKTSSEQTHIEGTLGLTASAGYGAIAASLSASLSASSDTTQQYVISLEVTHEETRDLSNDSEAPQMFITWQLADVLTVFAEKIAGYVPLASIMMAERPILVTGPYNPSDLPAAEVPAVATAEELAEVPVLTEVAVPSTPVGPDSRAE